MKHEKAESFPLAGRCPSQCNRALLVGIVGLTALASQLVVRPAYCQAKRPVDFKVALPQVQVDDYVKSFMDTSYNLPVDGPRVENAGDRYAPPATPQTRIELPGHRVNPGQTDGHKIVYRNDVSGEFIYGDVTGGTKRVIFKAKPDDLPSWLPSRDFSMVGLRFEGNPDRPGFFAVINTDGTHYRELASDVALANVFGDGDGLINWSWDNRHWLVIRNARRGGSRLLVLSVANGESRELVALGAGLFVHRAAFSPDGRFVAYQVSPEIYSSNDLVSRILVVPTRGGQPMLVHEEPLDGPVRLLDWTADGRFVAINSAATGRAALHLLPVRNGSASGAPVFVRYGEFDTGVTTLDGALVNTSIRSGMPWAVHVASFDSTGRPAGWQKLELYGDNQTNPWPHLSPDGNQIVYVATDREAGNEVVRVRNVFTGQDRKIYSSSGRIACVWATQKPKIFCSDWRQKTEIVSISPESGVIERFPTSTKSMLLTLRASRDDRALYLLKVDSDNVTTLRWEIALQHETVLEQSSGMTTLPSPDERWLIRAAKVNLEVRSLGGGGWKTLAPLSSAVLSAGTGYGQFAATPDGNWVLYHDADDTGSHGLYRIATSGGEPERLGDFPAHSASGTLEISQDGRKVIVASYAAGKGYELSLLESFSSQVLREVGK